MFYYDAAPPFQMGFMPGMPPQAPLPAAPPIIEPPSIPIEDEPPSKKLRGEDSLLVEAEFLAMHKVHNNKSHILSF